MAKNLLWVAVLISIQIIKTASANIHTEFADFKLIDILEHNKTLSTIGIIKDENELKEIVSQVSESHLNLVGIKIKSSFYQKLESAVEWYRQYFLIRSLTYENDLIPSTIGRKTNIMHRPEEVKELNIGPAMSYILNKRNALWNLPTNHLLVYEIAQDILLRLGGSFDNSEFISGIGPVVNDEDSTRDYKKALYVWNQLQDINLSILKTFNSQKYSHLMNNDLLELLKDIDHQLSQIEPKKNETFLVVGRSRFTSIHLTQMAYIKMAVKICSSMRRIFYRKIKSQSVYTKAINASFQTLDIEGANSEMLVSAILSNRINFGAVNANAIAKNLFENLQLIFKNILPSNDDEFLNNIPTTHFEHYKIMKKNINILLNTPLSVENNILSAKIVNWLFLTTYMGDKKSTYEESVLNFITRFNNLIEYDYILAKGLDLFIQMKSEHKGTKETTALHFELMNRFLSIVEQWKNKNLGNNAYPIIEKIYKTIFNNFETHFLERVRYSNYNDENFLNFRVYGTLDRIESFINFLDFYLKYPSHLVNESILTTTFITFIEKLLVFSNTLSGIDAKNKIFAQNYIPKVLVHLSEVINRSDITDSTRIQYIYLLTDSLIKPDKIFEFEKRFGPSSLSVSPLNRQIIDREREIIRDSFKIRLNTGFPRLVAPVDCEKIYTEN